MIDNFTEFYGDKKNKSLIDISGFVLVFTALILNISPKSGIANISLLHLQFFSLLASSFLLTNLLLIIGKNFIEKLFSSKDVIPVNKDKHEHLTHILAVTVLSFMVLLFFLFNLYLYIIVIYPKLSLFVAYIIAAYVLVITVSRPDTRPKKLFWGSKLPSSIIYGMLLLLLLVILPLLLYFFIFFNINIPSPIFM